MIEQSRLFSLYNRIRSYQNMPTEIAEQKQMITLAQMCHCCQFTLPCPIFRGRTHVLIKGQNLNFYLETHATPHNIYFIRLRILPRILVHYTGVWMTLYGQYTRRPYKKLKFELFSGNLLNLKYIYVTGPQNLARNSVHCTVYTGIWMTL